MKRCAIASVVPSDSGVPSLAYAASLFKVGLCGEYLTPLQLQAPEIVLDCFDALLLAGGGDINARRYGQQNHPSNTLVPALRDTGELALAKAFYFAGKPVLGICRGAQVLNVALDGTLMQHLPDAGAVHAGYGLYHEIELLPGSLLAQIMGVSHMKVNSSHHQAVRTLCPGASLCALSEDGVIEAFSIGERTMGVQFHPERMFEQARPLFQWFSGLL